MLNALRYRKYRRSHIGKFVDADGSFGYQCWDLIRSYCKEAYGYTCGQTPSAKDTSIKRTFPTKWREVDFVSEELKVGDIVTFKPTKTNKYGHIAIVDRVYDNFINSKFRILEQNGVGGGTEKAGNEIRKRDVPYGNLLACFRYIG